jgi:hypothetical protein
MVWTDQVLGARVPCPLEHECVTGKVVEAIRLRLTLDDYFGNGLQACSMLSSTNKLQLASLFSEASPYLPHCCRSFLCC